MADVAGYLGMTTHSLYAWIKKFGPDFAEHNAMLDQQAEIRRLKKKLKRTTEECDLLKKPRCTSPISPSEVHLYQGRESAQWPVRALYNLFDVHPSGHYAWLNKLRSKRTIASERLAGLTKQFWLQSDGV